MNRHDDVVFLPEMTWGDVFLPNTALPCGKARWYYGDVLWIPTCSFIQRLAYSLYSMMLFTLSHTTIIERVLTILLSRGYYAAKEILCTKDDKLATRSHRAEYSEEISASHDTMTMTIHSMSMRSLVGYNPIEIICLCFSSETHNLPGCTQTQGGM